MNFFDIACHLYFSEGSKIKRFLIILLISRHTKSTFERHSISLESVVHWVCWQTPIKFIDRHQVQEISHVLKRKEKIGLKLGLEKCGKTKVFLCLRVFFSNCFEI